MVAQRIGDIVQIGFPAHTGTATGTNLKYVFGGAELIPALLDTDDNPHCPAIFANGNAASSNSLPGKLQLHSADFEAYVMHETDSNRFLLDNNFVTGGLKGMKAAQTFTYRMVK